MHVVVMVIVMMIKMNRVAAMMVIMTKMRCCPSPHPLDGAVMFMARTMNGTADDHGDNEQGRRGDGDIEDGIYDFLIEIISPQQCSQLRRPSTCRWILSKNFPMFINIVLLS